MVAVFGGGLSTWRKAGELLDAFPPAECANYLRNSGYASV
jgi:hypothetical protein